MIGPGTAIEYPQIIANYANQFADGRQEKGTSIGVKDSSRAMSLPCACLVTGGVRDSGTYAGYHVELCLRVLAGIQKEQRWLKLTNPAETYQAKQRKKMQPKPRYLDLHTGKKYPFSERRWRSDEESI